jgi:hypothetical protein
MIDQLLAHRDAIPYTLAVGCIVLAVAMGYKLADKDPAEVCAEYVVKVERLQKQVDELSLELTECKAKGAGKTAIKAKGAGKTAIDCQTKIKASVSKALKDYKEVVCSD